MDNLTFTFNNSDVNWSKLNIRPTSLWGDGCSSANETSGTKYLTMNNIMLQNPHIVPRSVGDVASIRYGRAGGIQNGLWWETGVKPDGNFHIMQNGNNENSILLTNDGGLSSANWRIHRPDNWVRLRNRNDDTHIDFAAGNIYAHGDVTATGKVNTSKINNSYDITLQAGSGSWLFGNNGCVYSAGNCYTTSDKRLKENVNKISNPLQIINNLDGITYNLKEDEIKKNRFGYIAQDVEKVLPSLVSENPKTNYKHIDYTEMVPILSEGIKEMINQNKNKITTKEICINNTCLNEDEILFIKQLYKQR